MDSENSELNELCTSNNNPNDGYYYTKPKNIQNTLHTICTCMAIILSLLTLSVIIGALWWLQVSRQIDPIVNKFNNHGVNTDLMIYISQLPNGTQSLKTLLHHKTGGNITSEEEHVLRSIFDLFDENMNNQWALPEFEHFITTVVEPEKKFREMDFGSDDVLSFKEVALFLQSYFDVDLYKCDKTSRMIQDIFNYTYNDSYGIDQADPAYFEYLAHIWFEQLDVNKEGFVAKATYLQYMNHEEWLYHNKNKDDIVDFSEFRDSFFDSIYYTSYKKWYYISIYESDLVYKIEYRLQHLQMDTSAVASYTPQFLIHALDDTIAAYEAQLSSERTAETILYYDAANVFGHAPVPTSRRRLQSSTGADSDIYMAVCLKRVDGVKSVGYDQTVSRCERCCAPRWCQGGYQGGNMNGVCAILHRDDYQDANGTVSQDSDFDWCERQWIAADDSVSNSGECDICMLKQWYEEDCVSEEEDCFADDVGLKLFGFYIASAVGLKLFFQHLFYL